MRYVRLPALIGGLVLLVATSVALFNHWAELRTEQDLRVVAASLGAEATIESMILRAEAVADVAGPEATATDLVGSFADGANACVAGPDGVDCSGPDLLAAGPFETAVGISSARGGRAVAVADVASGSVLVVSHAERTVAIQLPAELFVGRVLSNAVGGNAAIVILLADEAATSARGEPENAGGRRIVTAVDGESLDAGSVVVTASVEDRVGLGGDAPVLFGVLLAVGLALLVLAGWAFLVAHRSLERRATTDELTGLINRREFEHECDEALEMAVRFGTGLCVMLLDLNGFKQINDARGHQFGDLVLTACAERLTAAVRDTDVVGRWGGDEFVILLPGMEEEAAVHTRAERIATGLSRTPVADDVHVTASVGAALFPGHGTTLAELIRSADIAMYDAKAAGVALRVADPVPVAGDGHGVGPVRHDGPERRRGSRRGSRV